MDRLGVDRIDFALRTDSGAPAQRERDLAEARAIAAVWWWFIRSSDRFDLPFATIVMKVRARCSSANVERIQAEFARRHRRALQRGVWG